jgi:hypothetical protein
MDIQHHWQRQAPGGNYTSASQRDIMDMNCLKVVPPIECSDLIQQLGFHEIDKKSPRMPTGPSEPSGAPPMDMDALDLVLHQLGVHLPAE